jgi:hypothetical protein
VNLIKDHRVYIPLNNSNMKKLGLELQITRMQWNNSRKMDIHWPYKSPIHMEQLAKNDWFIETNGAKIPLGLSIRRIRSFKVACRGYLYQVPQHFFIGKVKISNKGFLSCSKGRKSWLSTTTKSGLAPSEGSKHKTFSCKSIIL